MPIIVPNVGEIVLLTKMLKAALSVDENYTLRLYKNNYTPTGTSVTVDFTEADFTNYTEKTLTRAGWGTPTTVSNKAASTYSAVQTWTCGASGNTIYGCYVVGATSGTLLWAEKFSTARPLALMDVLNFTPVFTLNSQN